MPALLHDDWRSLLAAFYFHVGKSNLARLKQQQETDKKSFQIRNRYELNEELPPKWFVNVHHVGSPLKTARWYGKV